MVFDTEVLKTWFIVTRWLSFAVQWLDYRWKTSYRGTSSILHRRVETAYEVHLRSWPVSTVSFSSELITPTWPFLSHIFYIKTTCTYLYFGTRFRALETVKMEKRWSGEEEHSPELYSDVFIPLWLLNTARCQFHFYHYTSKVRPFLSPGRNYTPSLILLVTECVTSYFLAFFRRYWCDQGNVDGKNMLHAWEIPMNTTFTFGKWW